MSDDFSPISQGDTGSPFNATFQHLDGTVFPLVGATLSMKMQGISANTSGAIQFCTGAWTITDGPNGKASYAYAAPDVATVGTWLLYITATIGGKPVHADTKTLIIQSII